MQRGYDLWVAENEHTGWRREEISQLVIN